MSNDLNDVTPVDLDALQDAILTQVGAAFPGIFSTTGDYERIPSTIPCPAFFLDVVQIEPSEDDGTGQLNAFIRFDAYVIYKTGVTDNYKRECRKTALAVAGLVNANRWGQPAAPGKLLGCYKDTFDPSLDAYEVWRIEWHQETYAGISVWAGDIATVTRVLLAASPDVGTADQYADLTAGESA